jgi:hypothetical protein
MFFVLNIVSANCASRTIAGKLQSGGREITREKGERMRECVLLRKGFGISHKFDHLGA